ncbi:hypothetical protein GGR30_004054 [Martelella radicis]|uniref:Transposase n=1 Tax=Martelella radicis TaxID=1397476 RepID=A0A7W6KML6_9HYPH|nr:hypothetical protein [Martelella radicis]
MLLARVVSMIAVSSAASAMSFSQVAGGRIVHHNTGRQRQSLSPMVGPTYLAPHPGSLDRDGCKRIPGDRHHDSKGASLGRPACKAGNVIEGMLCRLKDWRHVATRYDKLAANFASAIVIAAIIIRWAR